MSVRIIWTFLFVIVLAFPSFAQIGSIETDKVKRLYEEFRHQEVIQEAEEILQKNSNMSIEDECEILRLLSLSYYSQQDMQGALKNFAKIIELDPQYRLNPVENSPKILAFFEEIRHQTELNTTQSKIQTKENITETVPFINADSLEQSARQQMALSIFLPGSGQIGKGEKTKGWLLMGGNVVLLGAFVYFAIETNRLENVYLQETKPINISNAYEDYNQAYQNRNLALAGFIAIWVYTQIDYLYISQPKSSSGQLSWYPKMDLSGKTSLNITYQF